MACSDTFLLHSDLRASFLWVSAEPWATLPHDIAHAVSIGVSSVAAPAVGSGSEWGQVRFEDVTGRDTAM